LLQCRRASFWCVVPFTRNASVRMKVTEFAYPFFIHENRNVSSLFVRISIESSEITLVQGLGGIHLDADACVVVDKETGLFCHWFWLRAPQKVVLCKVTPGSTYAQVVTTIKAYRRARLPATKTIAASYKSLVIGGCGGDVRALLTEYIKSEAESLL